MKSFSTRFSALSVPLLACVTAGLRVLRGPTPHPYAGPTAPVTLPPTPAPGAAALPSATPAPTATAAPPPPPDNSLLEQLRVALKHGNGPAVLQITDLIRRPFESPPPLEVTAHTTPPPEVAVVYLTRECVFDDQVFSLTPAARDELKTQLQQPRMKEALRWARSGGWWSCSPLNAVCKCPGKVHLVRGSREMLGQEVDARLYGGQVACSVDSFGAAAYLGANERWEDFSCECSSASASPEKDNFHLQKRLSSISILQEGWLLLLRILGRSGLLPLGTGDRTYSGAENWVARTGRTSPGLNVVLERFWISKFVREKAALAVKGPRCLEWGDPAKPGTVFNYASMVPGCTQKYDMQFNRNYEKPQGMRVEGNVVRSDLNNLPRVLGQGLQMNAIFATQVFEHFADPLAAAQSLFHATAPSGVLVYSGPQQAQYHKGPSDFYRYTAEGIKYALVRAGFCVPNNGFAGGGDFVFDIARAAGLQIQDFPMEEIDAAYQVGYDKISHSAVIIHCLAFKPPHVLCSDATAGWDEVKRRGIQA